MLRSNLVFVFELLRDFISSKCRRCSFTFGFAKLLKLNESSKAVLEKNKVDLQYDMIFNIKYL